MSKDKPKPKAKRRRDADKHRQCPTCHHGQLNGVGQIYKTIGQKSYYKCDRCGHNWTVTVNPSQTVIEHRQPEVDSRQPPPGSER